MATTTARVKAIDASYYYVKDMDRARKFYQDLLGFEPSMTYESMVTEWTFPGGESFGLYKAPEDEGFHPGGGLMFQVEDVPGTVESLKKQGVKFMGEGHVEETPGCHMAFGHDTEGNGFILHKRK